MGHQADPTIDPPREASAALPPAAPDAPFEALAGALDLLPQGVIAAPGDGRVLWVNRAARALLAARDALAVRRGILCCRWPQESQALQALIAAATAPEADAGRRSGALCVADSEGRVYALSVKAARIESRASPDAGADNAPAARRIAIVFAADPYQGAEISTQALSDLYGLSPCEARVAAAIAAGRTLQDYAAQAGVGLGTARWQLKRVLEKTGTNRQAELVRLVLCGPAAVLPGAAAE